MIIILPRPDTPHVYTRQNVSYSIVHYDTTQRTNKKFGDLNIFPRGHYVSIHNK